MSVFVRWLAQCMPKKMESGILYDVESHIHVQWGVTATGVYTISTTTEGKRPMDSSCGVI